jgi:type I restriction-modification system DNA methylase subunit
MPKPRKQKETNDSGLNFEAQLWAAADKMRGNKDGQESNYTTWKLARINLAIDANTFRQDLHFNLKAHFILANPPYNTSDWGRTRWKLRIKDQKGENQHVH